MTLSSGCAAATSPSGSNSGNGSGSSSSNSFMRLNFNGKGSGGKGGPGGEGGQGSLDLDTFEWVPDSQFLTSDPDFSPLTVLDNINLKTEFPYSTNPVVMDKPPDLDPPGPVPPGDPPNLFHFTASVPPVPESYVSSSTVSDVFTQSLYDDLVDINLNDFNLASVTTVPSSTAHAVLADIKASFFCKCQQMLST